MKERNLSVHLVVFAIALCCTAFLLLPCAGQAAAKHGGILKVGVKMDPRTYLDPHVEKGYVVIFVCQQLYEYLAMERGDGTIEPRLAERWENSEDGTEWTFHLRKGVKFHDGTDWDAEALKWNIERMMDPETKSYFAPSFRPVVDNIEVVDKYTCRFHLKRPAYLIATFVGEIFKPQFISPSVVKKYGKDWVKYPAGTGPFMFERMDEGGEIHLRRNPNYWEKGIPYLDGVIFKFYRDPQARNNAVRAGEIDMEMSASFEHYLISRQDPNLASSLAPASPYALNLGSNVTLEPWKDIRVRKAILGYALDREKVCKMVYHGTTVPKINPASSAHPYYEDLNSLYPFDLKKAEELLKETGMIGKTIKLSINNTTATYDAIGAILKGDLAKIGVTLEIEKMEYATWIKEFYVAHKIPFSLPLSYFNDPSGWIQYVGPTAAMNPTQAGVWLDQEKKVNQDPVLLELLTAASLAMKEPERKASYQKLFRHLAENAYYVGIVSPPIFHNFRKGVEGYQWRLLNMVLDTVYMAK